MIVEVLQGIYKSPLVSSWVECVNPCGRINRTQGFVVHPIGAYGCVQMSSDIRKIKVILVHNEKQSKNRSRCKHSNEQKFLEIFLFLGV